jgi:hypothetical protein
MMVGFGYGTAIMPVSVPLVCAAPHATSLRARPLAIFHVRLRTDVRALIGHAGVENNPRAAFAGAITPGAQS